MDDATAASALAGFSAKLNSIAAPMRQTLTYDRGKEMSRHADLSAQTGVRVTSATRPALCHARSEEHTSELQSLMRISSAVFCLQTNSTLTNNNHSVHNDTT